MKKLLILSVIVISLTSCGKSYLVRDLQTNHFSYLESSEVGNDFKEGDTIRTENVHRLTDIGVVFETTKFTGVVEGVENK